MQTLLPSGKSFLFRKIFRRVYDNKFTTALRESKQLKRQKATGVASAMKRH